MANPKISYWERVQLEHHYPVIIIGAGIVGLSTAKSILKRNPNIKILIIEKEPISRGASTRNAGFACFGSPSEILADLETRTESQVFTAVKNRITGLKMLRESVPDRTMDFHETGGHEVFFNHSEELDKCIDAIPYLNTEIEKIAGLKDTYQLLPLEQRCGVLDPVATIFNKYEGYLHPGKLIGSLEQQLEKFNVRILKGVHVSGIKDADGCIVSLKDYGELSCNHCIVSVNGLAKKLLPDLEIFPGRNQLMLSQPLKDLSIKGTYYSDQGYIYWRNIGNRLLIGGMGNQAMETESTDEYGTTPFIIDQLKQFVSAHIYAEPIQYDYTWSGILGLGYSKEPIVKKYSKHIVLAMRLGGMGVAMGLLVGEKAAQLTNL